MKEVLDIVLGVGVWVAVSIFWLWTFAVSCKKGDVLSALTSIVFFGLSGIITIYGIHLFL